MSYRRGKLIEFVFDKLDLDKSGYVDQSKMRKFIRTHAISEILTGEKKEVDVLKSMMKEFDQNNEGGFSRADFEDYYAGISFFTESDRKFEATVGDFWRLSATELGQFEQQLLLFNQEERQRGRILKPSSSSGNESADVAATVVADSTSVGVSENDGGVVGSGDIASSVRVDAASSSSSRSAKETSCDARPKNAANESGDIGNNEGKEGMDNCNESGVKSSSGAGAAEGKFGQDAATNPGSAIDAKPTMPATQQVLSEEKLPSVNSARYSRLKEEENIRASAHAHTHAGAAELSNKSGGRVSTVTSSRNSFAAATDHSSAPKKITSKVNSRSASLNLQAADEMRNSIDQARRAVGAGAGGANEGEEKLLPPTKPTAAVFADIRRKRSSFPEDNIMHSLRVNAAKMTLGLADTSTSSGTHGVPEPKTGSKEGISTSTKDESKSENGGAGTGLVVGVGVSATVDNEVTTREQSRSQLQQSPEHSPRPPDKSFSEKIQLQAPQGDSPRNGGSASRHGKLKLAITSISSNASVDTSLATMTPTTATELQSASQTAPGTAPGTEPGTPFRSFIRRRMSMHSKNVLSSSEVDLFSAFVPDEAKELVKNLFEEMEQLRKENAELKAKTADYDGIKGKVDLLLSENMDLRANCGELRAKLEAAEQKVVELNRNLVADAVMSPMAMSLASTLSSTRSSQAALVIGKRSEERTAAMASSALYPVVEGHADDASVSELDRANTDLRHAQEVIEAQKHTISSQETTIGLFQRILSSATEWASSAITHS